MQCWTWVYGEVAGVNPLGSAGQMAAQKEGSEDPEIWA